MQIREGIAVVVMVASPLILATSIFMRFRFNWWQGLSLFVLPAVVGLALALKFSRQRKTRLAWFCWGMGGCCRLGCFRWRYFLVKGKFLQILWF